MAESPHQAPRRELLLASHDFPGQYVVKAFGPGGGDFEVRMRAAVSTIVANERARFSSRTSSRGHKLCVTVHIHAENVDEVIAVYEEIHKIEELLLIF